MNETKPWWMSNGAWANLLQVVTSMAVMYHAITPSQADVIDKGAPSIIVGAIMLGLGAWGLWGRITATKRIG